MLFLLSAVLVVLILIIFLFVNNFTRIRDYVTWRNQMSKLPTLAGKKFFIGHAGMLLGMSNEASWAQAREWYKTASPLHTVYLGPTLILVALLEPDEIEAVISPMKNLAKNYTYNFVREWLEDGLLTSSGKKWQNRRKMLTPAFHFSILRGFTEIFTREMTGMVKEIEENYLNKPIDITPLITNFTLMTINETSMGTKLDIKSMEGLSYKNAIYRMGEIVYKRIITPWLHYKFIFNLTIDRINEKMLIKILHNFTDNIIRKRAENFKVFDDDTIENEAIDGKIQKRPLMDVLLNIKFKENGIDEKGIREEVNTFMFEGHDTTTMSLLYTCMLLACHSDIQDAVYQEITQILGSDMSKEPTYADLQDMTLMERCIKESLRLYPAVAIFGRILSDDVQTKYGLVPKGTTCFIQVYDLHRNPKFWTDPHKFDPSRHLPENCRGRHPFAYIPFSAGPRNCIGQRFAMLEMKTAICGLVRKFILEPIDTPDTLVLTQDLVLRPRDGVRVKFALRN